MEQMHADRLMKLARFLYRLPKEKFDFGTVINGKDIPNETFSCGTVGCAIGWMPMVFPERFEWRKAISRVRLFDKECPHEIGNGNFIWSASDFFGISTTEGRGLFIPGAQERIHMEELSEFATPKDVALTISAFVRIKFPDMDTTFDKLFF